MRTGKRSICVILSAVLIGTLLTGCQQVINNANSYLNNSGQQLASKKTISKDSKWINSDVVGTVTQDTAVNEKDDFATAENKDWILSVTDRVKKEKDVSRLGENATVITQQKQDLLKEAVAGGNFEENHIGMDSADYEHLSDIFTKVVSAAADWDTRNKEGIKPLKKYIAAIDSIDSLQQMNQYLCNEDGMLFSTSYLIPFSVETSFDEDCDEYKVTLSSSFDNSMVSNDENMDPDLYQDYLMDAITGILKELGYSSSESVKIVKQCWQLETALSEYTSYNKLLSKIDLENPDSLATQFNHPYSEKDLANLAGNYPLMDILQTYHYDTAKQYIVCEPNYIHGVSKLYKEKNLGKIKSYYIVHTILDAMPLLTRDYYDKYEKYFNTAEEEDTDTDSTPEKNKDSGKSFKKLSKEDQILESFVTNHINDVFEEMYAANYCSSEQKEAIQAIIQKAITEYEKILESEDWMSDQTKQKAIEKLNNITTRVLYPDELNTFKDLQLDNSNLIDIVAKLNTYNIQKDAGKIDQKIDKKGWDLNTLSTTTVNAFYRPSDNSICILAGAIATKELFDVNASNEENLAHLGYIIGHEISHAFDTTGYMYDKDGNPKKWWTDKDEETFQKRVAKLANYYSSFKSFRNSPSNINGEQIEGEAIADIAGLKCMIAISKQDENFDYQKFFRSFAQVWSTCRDLSTELQVVDTDVHPLPFLRINVTVQQFDEFHKAFDIQPGDGMYLAPEKRISVW